LSYPVQRNQASQQSSINRMQVWQSSISSTIPSYLTLISYYFVDFPNNIVVIIPWDVEVINAPSDSDTQTPFVWSDTGIAIPQSGYYAVSMYGLLFTTFINANMYIYTNDVLSCTASSAPPVADANGYCNFNCNVVRYFNEGDLMVIGFSVEYATVAPNFVFNPPFGASESPMLHVVKL